MIQLDSLGLKFQFNEDFENPQFEFSVLDQRRLPSKEEWVDVRETSDLIQAIYELKVRGAPLIGVAASLGAGVLAASKKKMEFEEWANEVEKLKASRPTAVNLMWALEALLEVARKGESPDWSKKVLQKSIEIFKEDQQLCANIASSGEALIEDGDQVLTHCNTGGLATAGVGTALGVIRRAYESGKKIHVYVDETRPLLQGGRLTTFELEKLGIPYTLICDNMAAELMRDQKVNKVIVGADRIATNGDFANKIGTYGLAVQSKFHGIPFYTAAPYSTIDPDCPNGKAIHIEQRKPDEVRGFQGVENSVIWAAAQSPVYNPAFDWTPSELVSGWVLDQGFFKKFDWQELKKREI